MSKQSHQVHMYRVKEVSSGLQPDMHRIKFCILSPSSPAPSKVVSSSSLHLVLRFIFVLAGVSHDSSIDYHDYWTTKRTSPRLKPWT